MSDKPVMDDRKMVVRGAGGGKQKKAHTPVEQPNTLQAAVRGRILDLIAYGPIHGLVDGLKSVYLDSTPVQNSDGTFNFEGVTIETREGYPDQDVIPGFRAAENIVDINTEVLFDNPPVRTVSNLDADAVVVMVQLAALVQQQENGDSVQASVDVYIDLRIGTGSWENRVTHTIKGKTTSPFPRSFRVDLPKSDQDRQEVQIRVRRGSKESENNKLQDKMTWAYMTEVIDKAFTYPDMALVGISVDAKLFGNQLPPRSYDMKLSIISVPDNYNPETREYTGIWYGGFKKAWSDNPAWAYYDLATHPVIGAGIKTVDKWLLYRIGQYCDELVEDGYGGMEPRFTINTIFSEQEDAIQALNSLASAFRGISYWGTDTVVPVADMPSAPKKIVAPANVIDGEFETSGTGMKERHSVCIVMYNDKDDAGKSVPEIYEDPDSIVEFGWRETRVTAVGCNSRGQALRLAKWILYSERMETQTLTYKTTVEHADLRPGDIIEVADPDAQGARMGGRLLDSDQLNPVLDQVPTEAILAGQSAWFLKVFMPDGSIITSEVSSFSGNTAHLLTPLPSRPVDGAMWALFSVALQLPQWRITSVREDDGGQTYTVVATEYDPRKYDIVEKGLVLAPRPTSMLPTGSVAPPMDLSFLVYKYLAGGTEHQGVTISWTPSNDVRVDSYVLDVMGPTDTAYRTVYNGPGVSFDLPDAIGGQWLFRVRAFAQGVPSQWVMRTVQLQVLLLPVPPDKVEVKVGTLELSLFPVSAYPDQLWEFWRSTVPLQQEMIEGSASYIATGTFLVDTGLKPDTQYYYFVRGVNQYGKSTWYAVQAKTDNNFDEIMEAVVNDARNGALGKWINDQVDDGTEKAIAEANAYAQSIADEAELLIEGLQRSVTTLNSNINNLRADVTQEASDLWSQINLQIGNVNSTVSDVNKVVQELQGKVANLVDALAYDKTLPYVENDVVRVDKKLYRAIAAVPAKDDGSNGPPNALYWKDIGEVIKTSEGFAARIDNAETNISKIQGTLTTQASSLQAVQAGLDGKASGSVVSAMNTRLEAVEGDNKTQGQNITALTTDYNTLNTKVDNKAEVSTVNALSNQIESLGSTVTAQGKAVTTINAALPNIGSENLLYNPSFERAGTDATLPDGWGVTLSGAGMTLNRSLVSSTMDPSGKAMRADVTGMTTALLYADVAPIAAKRSGVTAGQVYTFSVYLRGTPGLGAQIYLQTRSSSGNVITTVLTTPETFTLTDTWQRYTLTTPATPATTVTLNPVVRVRQSPTGSLTAGFIEIDRAQLELGSAVTGWRDNGQVTAADTRANAEATNALSGRVEKTEEGLTAVSDQSALLTTNLLYVSQNADIANTAAQNAYDLANGKGKVIYQATAPAVADRQVQNLWMDTSTGATTPSPKRWNGTAWVSATDKAAVDAATAAQQALTEVAKKADASALQQLNTTVSQIGSTVTSQGASLVSLNNTLGRALSNSDTKVYQSVFTDLSADKWVSTNTGTGATAIMGSIAGGTRGSGLSLNGGPNNRTWWGSSTRRIRFDPNTLYKLSVRVQQVEMGTGAPATYAGLDCYQEDGTTRINVHGEATVGSSHYILINNRRLAKGEWITAEVYVKGHTVGSEVGGSGAGTVADPKRLRAGTAWITPLVIAGYDNVGGLLAVDFFDIEDVTERVQIEANSAATSALTSKVEETARGLTSVSGQMTVLTNGLADANKALGNKADSSTITALNNKVDKFGETLTAQGSSITDINASLSQAGSENLLYNPSFDSASASNAGLADGWGWRKTATVTVTPTLRDSDLGAEGKCQRLDLTGFTAGTGEAYVDFVPSSANPDVRPPVYEGVVNTASVYVRGNTGLAGQIYLQYKDAAGATIRTDGPVTTALTPTYQRLILTSNPAPANAIKLDVLFRLRSAPGSSLTGGFVDLDKAQLELGSIATGWRDNGKTNAAAVALNARATATLAGRVGDFEEGLSSASSQITQLDNSLGDAGGENLFYNPTFNEAGIGGLAKGWVTEGNSPTVATSLVSSWMNYGEQAQRISVTGVNNGSTYRSLRTEGDTRIKVAAGQAVAISAYVRGSVGLGMRIYIQWMNTANTVVAAPSSDMITVKPGGERIQFSAVAPNGAVQAYVYFRIFSLTSAAADGYVDIARPQAEYGTRATGWKDNGKVLAEQQASTSSALQSLTSIVTQQGKDQTSASQSITSLNNKVVLIGASGVNLLPADYSVFKATAPVISGSSFTYITEADVGTFKGHALKFSWTSTNNGLAAYFAKSANGPDANMGMKPQKYIVSYYARASVAGHVVAMFVRAFQANNTTVVNSSNATQQALTTSWARYSDVVDLTGSGFTGSQMMLVFQMNRSGAANRSVWIDRIMVEPVVNDVIEPSTFDLGSSFDQVGQVSDGLQALTTSTAEALNSLKSSVTQLNGSVVTQSSDLTSLRNSLGNIGGENLFYNPSFDRGTNTADGWVVRGTARSTPKLVPSTLDPSGLSQRIDVTGLTATGTITYMDLAQSFGQQAPVTEGQILTASTYVRGTVALLVQIYFQFKNAASTTIATHGPLNTVLDGSWQRISYTSQAAPADCVSVDVLFRVRANGGSSLTGGFAEFDRAQCELGETMSGWSDNTRALWAGAAATSTAVESLTSKVESVSGQVTSQGTSLTNLNNVVAGINGAVNLLPAEYTTFGPTPPPLNSSSTGVVVTTEASSTALGKYLLRVNNTTASVGWFYLASATTDWTMKLKPGKSYILSFWARTDVARTMSARIKYRTATSTAELQLATIPLAVSTTMTRVSAVLTMPAALLDDTLLVFYSHTANLVCNGWYDGFMLEEQIGSGTEPSTFSASNSSRQFRAASEAIDLVDSKVTVVDGAVTSQGTRLTSLENAVNSTTNGLPSKASTSALNSMGSRVTATENALTSQASDLTNLRADVNSAQGINFIPDAYTWLTEADPLVDYLGFLKPSTVELAAAPSGYAFQFTSTTTGQATTGLKVPGSVYPMSLSPGVYLLSFYGYTTNRTSLPMTPLLSRGAGTDVTGGSINLTATRTRYRLILNVTVDSRYAVYFTVTGNSGATMRIDSLMLERQTGNSTAASAFINGQSTVKAQILEGQLTSQASTISSLTSRMGSNEATVSSVASTVNGMSGMWGVKVVLDANGKRYIAGMGVNVTTAGGITQGEILFQAERLTLLNIATGGMFSPFFVSNNIVYINQAMIQDASIGSAKIAQAAIKTAHIGVAEIDTLRVAGNAITVPISYRVDGEVRGAGRYNWMDILNISLPMEQAGFIFILFNCGQNYTSGARANGFILSINGVQLMAPTGQAATPAPIVSGSIGVGPGVHNIKVQWYGDDASVFLDQRNIFVMGTKR